MISNENADPDREGKMLFTSYGSKVMCEAACYETMGQRLMVTSVLTPGIIKANPNLLLKSFPWRLQTLNRLQGSKAVKSKDSACAKSPGVRKIHAVYSSIF